MGNGCIEMNISVVISEVDIVRNDMQNVILVQKFNFLNFIPQWTKTDLKIIISENDLVRTYIQYRVLKKTKVIQIISKKYTNYLQVSFFVNVQVNYIHLVQFLILLEYFYQFGERGKK
jgi:hypothetical protein